jgi:lipopolysaccharide assembly protein A
MRFINAVLLLTFLAALAIFAVQNTQTVTVRFLNWALSAPLALLSLVLYFVGMLSGWNVVSFLRRSIHRVSEESHAR